MTLDLLKMKKEQPTIQFLLPDHGRCSLSNEHLDLLQEQSQMVHKAHKFHLFFLV